MSQPANTHPIPTFTGSDGVQYVVPPQSNAPHVVPVQQPMVYGQPAPQPQIYYDQYGRPIMQSNQTYPSQFASNQPPPVTSVYAGKPTTSVSSSSSSSSSDIEAGVVVSAGATKLTPDLPVSIRHAFIRKVYGILFAQLFLTFGIALTFGIWKEAGAWLIENQWLWITSVILQFTVLIVLVCVPGVAEKWPINLILLFIFSALFGITMGFLAAQVSVEAFLAALGITMVVVVAITIFACQTKIDFTGFAPYALVLLLVLICFGILAAILNDRVVNLVYGCLGAAVFSLYLVFDTQMVVGGKNRRYQFTVDDYVLASLSLYMDIINIFTYILLAMEA